MANLLAALALAGIVERTGRHRRLRVAPRFMAHAERTAPTAAGRAPEDVLHAALATWEEYRHDLDLGAALLVELLDAREQWGPLQPVFPALAPVAA